ncbi:hypothetical protein ERUR111494_07085 [Erysipelothrix urinaevulpis]|uniref:hypothetical protein n=1 Tax=Erysipelothrix urinaevulpis TaxID=2683717 RepID=UPI001359A767|nr:hypothetical protein [Erysipelothrix urinaevulpis]
MNLKDRIFSYCIVNGVRFTAKQKKKFLYATQVDFTRQGKATRVVQSDLKVSYAQTIPHYNLYVGDVEKAEYIITTYYDTSTKLLDKSKVEAFSRGNSKRNSLIQITLSILLTMFLVGTAYIFIIPSLLNKSIFSLQGVLVLAYLFLSLFIIKKVSKGFPNRYNFVRNSSSVIAMIEVAERLQSSKIAYAVLDGGTATDYGIKMLRSIADQNAKIIYLDSIANEGPIHVFSDLISLKSKVKPKPLEHEADILVTFGELTKGKIYIENANTSKDNQINEKIFDNNISKLEQEIELIIE